MTETTDLDRWYNRARRALYLFKKDDDPDYSTVELVMDAMRQGNPSSAIGYVFADMGERESERWSECCEECMYDNEEDYDNPSILECLPTYQQPLYLLALLRLTGTGKKTDLKYRDMLLGMATDMIRDEAIQESLTIAMTQTILDAYTEIEPWQRGLVLTELRQMCEEKEEDTDEVT